MRAPEESPMRRQWRCRACGAKVITDDEALTIVHDSPVCDGFDAIAREGAEVRDVNAEAVDAHLDALATRVRNRRS
jgi:hypothetical protein